MRYAYPLQSEFHEPTQTQTSNGSSKGRNMYMKRYPNFFKREDVRRDFVAVQQELRVALPHAKIVKEDIDTSFAHVQFDVSTADEVLLERLLGKRGFIKA